MAARGWLRGESADRPGPPRAGASRSNLNVLGRVMKRCNSPLAGVSLLALAGLLTLGCGKATGPQSAARESGRQFLLADEPANPLEVIQLRDQLEESPQTADDVVLVGRIDGLSHPTWDAQRAAFMLADRSLQHDEEDHDAASHHDADNCPFCKAKVKKELHGLALVEIVDSHGEVPSVDARELLGVSEGQTIVARGSAKLDALGTLVFRVNKLYVRPEGK